MDIHPLIDSFIALQKDTILFLKNADVFDPSLYASRNAIKFTKNTDIFCIGEPTAHQKMQRFGIEAMMIEKSAHFFTHVEAFFDALMKSGKIAWDSNRHTICLHAFPLNKADTTIIFNFPLSIIALNATSRSPDFTYDANEIDTRMRRDFEIMARHTNHTMTQWSAMLGCYIKKNGVIQSKQSVELILLADTRQQADDMARILTYHYFGEPEDNLWHEIMPVDHDGESINKMTFPAFP